VTGQRVNHTGNDPLGSRPPTNPRSEAAALEPIHYAVDLSQRVQHLVGVTMTVPADLADGARLVVPTWTPGSYVERNYVHHLQSHRATDATGDQVPLQADGHTSFVLPHGVEAPVTIHLEWYANDLTVRTNHVDDHHALLVPPATFPYVAGAEDRPCLVTVTPTAGHRVWGLLPLADGDDSDGNEGGEGGSEDPPTFAAIDYLHLVDSAFEVGDLPVAEFSIEGVPHRWVHASHHGGADLDRLQADVTAISEQARAIFDGAFPIESYTFLCVGADSASGGGGLEHRDGAVLMLPVLTDAIDKGVRRTRSLIAHEYLHLWNVKRLVPAELVHFTLDRPQHTSSLWVAEGWTAYYDDLLPARADLTSPREYLDSLRDDLVWVERAPGARRQTVAEASWHAWTGLYVREENSLNAGTNYYTHGAVIAAALDLLIRDANPGGDGLDDAFRILWHRFGHDQPRGYPTTGYTHQDVVDALSEAAGRDLSDFTDDHVLGTEPPPLADLLDTVGLRLEDTRADVVRPDLGVQSSDDGDAVVVNAVFRDRPAWQAGITGGDRIVAIDGLLIGRGELEPALATFNAGDIVRVTVARGARLLELDVELADPVPERRIVATDEPDEQQVAAFTAWTHRTLSEL